MIGSADTAFCDRQSVIGLKNPDRSTPNIFHEIYACYRSARTSFIGERSVAGADVQPGGQVENRFAGDARCSKKKKKRIFESQN